ncbi:MAG: hypothetical protein DMG05_23980 [Acidobacteria bacterium]|nr:MAG: hypothetical protein DMG05_23980 [Acidobacteriota bacterium]
MSSRWKSEQGVSVIIVAAGLTAFLGFLALVIDLGMLYAARGDAHKAADAAALAGAKYFIDQGTLPSSLSQTDKNNARAFAKAIGSENKIRGANIQQSEVIVPDPAITVVSNGSRLVFQVTAQVQRNGLNTFFANIFGVTAVNVGATATAQAILPVGTIGGAPANYNPGANCLKPWILQNLNPSGQPFGPSDLGTYIYLLDDQSTNGPSKWGIIGLCPTYTAPPNEPCDGGNSSSVYEDNIVQCNPNNYYCSTGVTINDVPGNKVGKTQSGVRTLIHEGGGNQSEGTNNGQDTISVVGTGPGFSFTISGGSNNPNPALRNQQINTSDSIVIIPLTNSQPPSNGQLKVSIDGFLKVFLTQVHPSNAKPNSVKNQIDGIIIGFDRCTPSAPGGNGLPTVSGNAGPAILRLVQ